MNLESLIAKHTRGKDATRADYAELCEAARALEARVERLQQELNDAVPVIEFYASHETWWAVALMPDPPCGEIMEDFDIDESDPHQRPRPGKRARDVLRKYAALAAKEK